MFQEGVFILRVCVHVCVCVCVCVYLCVHACVCILLFYRWVIMVHTCCVIAAVILPI